MNKLMEMPPLGTEVATGNRMIPAGIRSDNPAAFNLEIYSTAAAAVVTDGHDVLHEALSSERLFLIIPLLFVRVGDNQQKSQDIVKREETGLTQEQLARKVKTKKISNFKN
jgi:hypothetical protein